jgi:RNA polymerase sigma-70 factor (ECF subfamily)
MNQLKLMEKQSLCSEHQLISLAKVGDKAAIESLIKCYQYKILQMISFNLLYDKSSAQDLMQEVLIKIFQNISEFNNESRFSSWVYRIVQNTLKNHYRMIHTRESFELDLNTQSILPLSPPPDVQIMDEEVDSSIEQALSMLTQDLRVCYGMHVIAGKSYQSIADTVHCPVGTVRSRIFRARKLISQFIKTTFVLE